MSAQVTHRRDPETGNLVQIVSPAELRRVLRRNGDSLVRPDDFGPDDEWDTGPTRYRVTATHGQYLRATMRTADESSVDDVLRSAARYIGEDADAEIERQDGGDVVLGSLVARPEVDS